jgi:DNA-directed RNA polymerase subunit RPC12/RpoP
MKTKNQDNKDDEFICIQCGKPSKKRSRLGEYYRMFCRRCGLKIFLEFEKVKSA